MRVIGHGLLLILCVVAIGAAVHLGFDSLETSGFWAGPKGVRVTRSTAYQGSTLKWLEFGMTERGPLRILSNCALDGFTEDAARYAVDYELIDASGKVVLSGRYHHRARMTLLHNPRRSRHKRLIAKTSYAQTEWPSSNSVEFWIEAPEIALPGRLRIRIAEQDGNVIEVAIRAYQRTTIPQRKAGSAWQRLSRRKREQLARGYAVPAEWLKPFEATALARHTWRALGPKGVDRQDYEERILLIVDDPKFERVREPNGTPLAKSVNPPEAT